MRNICKKAADCFGCGACACACTSGAVSMEPDREGFLYPVIDEALCTDCGRCTLVCPSGHRPAEMSEVSYYALRCKDETILSDSTSGGAFSLIALKILEKGGLVCGAVFDDSFEVVHVLSDEISSMRKAKYVQSRTADCFVKIKEALISGIPVLFSGTPCQCMAARMLFPDSESLYTASLVCRGVMSPKLWEEYRSFLERKGTLNAFCFRDKRKPDDAHTVAFRIDDTEYADDFIKNPLCRIYARELPLRPSCYSCPFTFAEKDFDFTLGDFWGAEKVFPDLADGKGTSLVITCGNKADGLFTELSESADIRETEKERILQPALVSPARVTMLRKFLFRDLCTTGPDGHCDMELILRKYGS